MSKKIRYKTFITHNELNIKELSATVMEDRNGAVVVFNGITRDHTDGRKVLFLEYEAYLPMAKAKLNDVADEMCDKWDVDVVIAH